MLRGNIRKLPKKQRGEYIKEEVPTNYRLIHFLPPQQTSSSYKKAVAKNLQRLFLRSKGDSNPRYAFDVYTLSRRASSTTRASLPRVDPVKTVANIIHFSGSTKVFTKIVSHFYAQPPESPLDNIYRKYLIVHMNIQCVHPRH